MSLENDRVRRHTAKSVLRCIDDETATRLTSLAEGPPAALDERLHRLDREWDTDRVIETEAALNGLVGLLVGMAVHPRALAWPGFVAAMVFIHAVTGRYPLMPLLRRLGVRTAREISRERYAIKALRGDFSALSDATGAGVRDAAAARTVVDERAGGATGIH